MQWLQQQHRCVDVEVSAKELILHQATQRDTYHCKCSANMATLTHHCITITHYLTAPQLRHWMQSHVIIQYHNSVIECHTTASYLCYPTTLFPGIQLSKKQPLQLIYLNWQTLHEITLYFFKSVKKYNTGQKCCNYQITNPCW